MIEKFASNSYMDIPNHDLFVTLGGTEDVDFVYWGKKAYNFTMSV